ncbi:ribosomal RNA processing 36 -like protein, partial [Brachionus plicatilis]
MAKNNGKNLNKGFENVVSSDDDDEQSLNEQSELETNESDEDNLSEIEENSNSDQAESSEDDEPTTSNNDGFRSEITSELNSMTFEQIQKLQNKLGLKKFKEVMQEKSAPDEMKNFKRLNKNRPQEISSK